MEVFRISKAKYASQLTASGNEGRWNYKGEKVIYTANSRALASLELLVHLSNLRLSNHFKIIVIHVPDKVSVKNILSNEMPEDWNGLSPYRETQDLGSKWVMSSATCLLRVPSSIIINEYNYVININHPQFKKLKIIDIEDYLFDKRIVQKMK